VGGNKYFDVSFFRAFKGKSKSTPSFATITIRAIENNKNRDALMPLSGIIITISTRDQKPVEKGEFGERK